MYFFNWISYNFCNRGICNLDRSCVLLLTNFRLPQLQFTQAYKKQSETQTLSGELKGWHVRYLFQKYQALCKLT